MEAYMAYKITNVLLTMVTLTAAALLTGCEDVDLNPIKTTETKSYEISGGGCTTGKQEYKNNAEYCAILIDDARNNFCAAETRYREYLKSCEKPTEEVAQKEVPIVESDMPTLEDMNLYLKAGFGYLESSVTEGVHYFGGDIYLDKYPEENITSMDFSHAVVEAPDAASENCILKESKVWLKEEGVMSYMLTFMISPEDPKGCDRFVKSAFGARTLILNFTYVHEKHRDDMVRYKRKVSLNLMRVER
jgi:hypothetical protein